MARLHRSLRRMCFGLARHCILGQHDDEIVKGAAGNLGGMVIVLEEM